MESLRILQFVPYFIPYPGGQERYVYNLSKYLIKMGHEVHVITSDYPKSKEFEEIDGITVERYRPLARPLRNPIVPKFFQVPRRFSEFDVVHIHNEHAFSSMIAAYTKRKRDFPLILTNHGKLVFGHYIADRIERTYMRYIGRRVFNVSDAIIVNSESDKAFISQISPESSSKILILPNSIDPDALLEKFKNSHVIHDEISADFIVLYVGALIKRKGVEWLIKALTMLRKSINKKIKCVLVGDGPDRKYFEALVRRYNLSSIVLFTGRISDEELIWWYNHSNIFVLPSLSEGLPTAILEAMYFGLPVIATDIPGVRDHFKDTAILVQPKNEHSLAAAITEIISNDDLRKRLSEKGKKLVEERYTWPVTAEKYVEVYKNVKYLKGM